MTLTRLLIANRGEIACRIIRTAPAMGIETVAVYSEADKNSLHIQMADQAVRIGGATAADSYLRGDVIIKAALSAGADAIHPGYGFLSENAAFADAVEAAGLIFVGPRGDSIRAMGMKDTAKRLMEKAGVPVVPGYHGEAQELVVLAGKANVIGYPVLIKAAAGGGGKGMRLVENPSDFREALASARREAKSAFGDDRVLVEKYITNPRHIEVQVFGDAHGNVVHLFERDCSAQRRHQKVIEEAPAPGMSAEVRKAMTDAAVKAAKAINYRGAGTIEFVVDGTGPLRADGFWFMEMNTRLQVEHPVTEEVTGVDLVAWQLHVARGEKLPLTQDEIKLNGHAFEARLYAEDAARGFLPATGTLQHLKFGDARIETGVRQGDAVSPFYDPMIAKIVTHSETRSEALDNLVTALEATEIAGTVTNLGFLVALTKDDDFAAGRVDTGMIARKGDALTAKPQSTPSMLAKAFLAASGLAKPKSDDVWDTAKGYRHFVVEPVMITLTYGDEMLSAAITVLGDRARISYGNTIMSLDLPNASESMRGIALWPGHVSVFANGHTLDFQIADQFFTAAAAGSAGTMVAPMPGLVKLVHAKIGQKVAKGDALLVLEAMKMEHIIVAARDGVLVEIASAGSQVSDGTVLAEFAGE